MDELNSISTIRLYYWHVIVSKMIQKEEFYLWVPPHCLLLFFLISPIFSVQTSKMYGFCQMVGLYVFAVI